MIFNTAQKSRLILGLLTGIIILGLYACGKKVPASGDTHLDLSGKKLKKIPDSVFKMTHLVSLNLGANKVVIYPPLSALKDPDVLTNTIKEIPSEIERLVNLKTLILHTNELTGLPESIIKLENLEELDVSLNPEFDVMNELEKLQKLKNLKELRILDVKLRSQDIPFIQKALPGVKVIWNVAQYFGYSEEDYRKLIETEAEKLFRSLNKDSKPD